MLGGDAFLAPLLGIYQKPTNNGGIAYEVRYYVPDPLAKNGWRQKAKHFDKYQDAVDFKVKRHAEIKTGDYVPPVDLTVKEIAEKFLEARKPRWKAQTYAAHEVQLNNYIRPRCGHLKATSLKAVDIETAGAEWNKRVSHKTVNKVFATLNRVYKFAKKLGVKTNPMLDVERLKAETTPEELDVLTEGEILDRGEDHPQEKGLRSIRADEVYSSRELRALIEAARPGHEKAFFMTAVLCALRHGELSGLRWQMVDLKKGSLFVNRSLTELKGGPVLERPKTKNAYRRLRLAPELIRVLTEWKLQCSPNPNGLVFVNPLGKPVARKLNNLMLKACCKRAGIRPLSMNNLRHSFASQHLAAARSPCRSPTSWAMLIRASRWRSTRGGPSARSPGQNWCSREGSSKRKESEKRLRKLGHKNERPKK
jgi:integrase